MRRTNVKILATGDLLVGRGIRSVYAVMEELIHTAKNEIWITTFAFGPGAGYILKLIEDALVKGVTVILIINHVKTQPMNVRKTMEIFTEKYPHFKLIDFNPPGGTLHAKIMVFDRKKAIIGSANLTWRGMTKNHEMGILLEGEPVGYVLRALENLV